MKAAESMIRGKKKFKASVKDTFLVTHQLPGVCIHRAVLRITSDF